MSEERKMVSWEEISLVSKETSFSVMWANYYQSVTCAILLAKFEEDLKFAKKYGNMYKDVFRYGGYIWTTYYDDCLFGSSYPYLASSELKEAVDVLESSGIIKVLHSQLYDGTTKTAIAIDEDRQNEIYQEIVQNIEKNKEEK